MHDEHTQEVESLRCQGDELLYGAMSPSAQADVPNSILQEPVQQHVCLAGAHPDKHAYVHLHDSTQLQKEAVNAQAAEELQHVHQQQGVLHARYCHLARLASTPFLGTYSDNITCAISAQTVSPTKYRESPLHPICERP